MNNQLQRLTNILVADKQNPCEKINSILKSDLFILLSQYFDLIEKDIECKVVAQDGDYIVKISARARRLKNFIVLD